MKTSASQSLIHTLYYSNKKSLKGFPRLQTTILRCCTCFGSSWICFSIAFPSSILALEFFAFFLAPFTLNCSGLTFLIIQAESLSLVTHNKGLMGSERGSVRTISGCLPFTVSESELSCKPRGRLILGVYGKSSVGLVMVLLLFLECLEGSKYDSLCLMLSLPFWRPTDQQTERFGKVGEAECHWNQRVSGSNLFSCQVLLGDPSPSDHCQLCELQQFG